MSNLTLAIMAAGMGSRYGGSKQTEKFGENGEILMEYSIYDALKAGFDRVVIIVKEEMLGTFREIAGDRLSRNVKVDYVFQRMTDVPDGFKLPEARVKPWGTAQAVAALDGTVNEPYCVINADDFYGRQSYELIADFLRNAPGDTPYKCCMAGYRIENTLSENGAVTRGVCRTDGTRLAELVETMKIIRREDGVIFDEETGTEFPEGSPVSMNMFGLQPQVSALLKERFGAWLKTAGLLKGEYLLPVELGRLADEGVITMDVLPTAAKWYGVTYHEDKAPLVERIREMIAAGTYPKSLWG